MAALRLRAGFLLWGASLREYAAGYTLQTAKQSTLERALGAKMANAGLFSASQSGCHFPRY